MNAFVIKILESEAFGGGGGGGIMHEINFSQKFYYQSP